VIPIPVTYIIIGITVIVSLIAFNNRELKYKLTFSPYTCKHHNKWYNVLTHGFVHGDYMHLIFNMFVLFSFGFQKTGPEYYDEGLEGNFEMFFGEMGQLWFLTLYIVGILVATLPAFYKHSDNPNYLAVGASGAVSAVLFASIVLHPFNDIFIFFIPIGIPSIIFGPLYLAYEIYMSKKGKGNIAHDAHIAGAIFGIIFICVLRLETFPELIDQISGVFA